MKTLKEFVEKYDLQLELTKVPFRTDLDSTDEQERNWNITATHYMFRIYASNAGKDIKWDLKGNFSQGSAIKNEPTIEDILDSLIIDTLNIDQSFENWCVEYGYDTDSRKAFQTYQLCLKEYKDLQYFLPSKILKELYRCETF